jgi:hypothetical protein
LPLTFRILPDLGLSYVRYAGHVTVAEAAEAIAAYFAHPDFRPGQKQLVDLAAVTSFERNYPELLALQAAKLERFGAAGADMLLAYHAPGQLARDMAMLIVRSWDGMPGVVARVLAAEHECLALLGLPHATFDDLLAASSPRGDGPARPTH